MLGAEGVSYPPIVASGSDACTIHYSRNDKVNCELLTCSAPSRSDHVSMTIIQCCVSGMNSAVCYQISDAFE